MCSGVPLQVKCVVETLHAVHAEVALQIRMALGVAVQESLEFELLTIEMFEFMPKLSVVGNLWLLRTAVPKFFFSNFLRTIQVADHEFIFFIFFCNFFFLKFFFILLFCASDIPCIKKKNPSETCQKSYKLCLSMENLTVFGPKGFTFCTILGLH